jgi:hypothetical protein
MDEETISLSERFTIRSRSLKYPIESLTRLEEIEDMAGKKNRQEAKEKYKKELAMKKERYREEQYKIDNEFKLALFKEYGVEDHPKREKVFDMAWQNGHASGYGDVEYHFSEYVELIKD